jgi:hypothetical protein
MSSEKEPPPLFDNVDIFDKEEDNDDLFASAMDVSFSNFLNLVYNLS